jgi:serine/threonine protein kinase
LSYFVQACRGVLALHDRRLVHFDLKPRNVFLKGEVARVGDYGSRR